MQARIVISVHRVHRMLHVRLAGFFTIADVAQYETAFRRAVIDLGAGPNQHLTLCDATEAALSTVEVTAAFQRVIAKPENRARRCALVVEGALARIQARRTADREDVMVFDNVPAAQKWLLSTVRDAA